MPSKVFSGAVLGLDALIIEVEVDLTPGLHSFQLVGLADKAIAESKQRIASAIKNTGALPPQQLNRRITINLAPADLKKEGSLYDLAIAVGYLAASEQIQLRRDPKRLFFIGELALDGSLRPVAGVLPLALEARQHGFDTLVLPQQNQKEAAFIEGLTVVAAPDLKTVIEFLEGAREAAAPEAPEAFREPSAPAIDLVHVRGQENAKRALEIAAAGGHHVLLSGQPGGGKTLLAQALPGLLPALTREEALEVTKIWSVAGMLPAASGMIWERPFRQPHHTASGIAIVGGGAWPRPGEITLAHRGVLFLDEFPEFHRDVVENLRQPLEDGRIAIARAHGSITFPARFQLVAAMNPCPCGYAGDPQHHCSCSPGAIQRYRKKISGPVMDRIDMHLEVPAVEYEKLTSGAAGETSAAVRQRIERVREAQRSRFGSPKTNAEMTLEELERFIRLSHSCRQALRSAVDRYKLSARGYHRVLKVSRTIADMARAEELAPDHIMEAAQFRAKTEV